MRAAVRKLLKIFLCLLALSILLGAGGYLFSRNFVILNGRPYSRSSTELDFSGQELPDLDILSELHDLRNLNLSNTGMTLGEHEWLQRQLPDCRITWEVLFQGKYYRPDIQSIRLSSLSKSDLFLLDYFPELTFIDARECRDVEALAALTAQWPDCWILYWVELAGEKWGQDTRILNLSDVIPAELATKLPALPKVEQVILRGDLPPMEEIRAMEAQFPQVQFSWRVELDGKQYPDTQTDLDLSLRTLTSPEALADTLTYFPELETLDFRGTRMLPEEREALQQKFPQVRMDWDYDLNGERIPVDARTADLSGHSLVTLEEIRQALPYLPELQKILLCDCGFSSEELVEFDEELEQIQVVWNVDVGGRDTRTDELYFAPNKWGLKLTDENIYNLRYCRKMVCVDIGHMHAVTNCEWAAFMPDLEFLILADGNVSDLTPLKGLKKLKFLELFLCPVRDLTPLTGCTALEDLNLCYIWTDPAPILEMTWLKRLWWAGCWPARNLLGPALPDTEKNFDTHSSTGGTWRQGPLYYEMRDLIGMGYMKG